MEGAKKEEKPVVCFLQPDFIQRVKGQDNPCFNVTVFDDATVFHVRLRDYTQKTKGTERIENGHGSYEAGACDSTKVFLKVFADGESLGDEEKVKTVLSEKFSKDEAGKPELLLIIGETLNEEKQKEIGIKVCLYVITLFLWSISHFIVLSIRWFRLTCACTGHNCKLQINLARL